MGGAGIFKKDGADDQPDRLRLCREDLEAGFPDGGPVIFRRSMIIRSSVLFRLRVTASGKRLRRDLLWLKEKSYFCRISNRNKGGMINGTDDFRIYTGIY